MSTFEDFENAPVGATAKKEVGLVAIREGDKTDYYPWMCTTYGDWLSNDDLAERGYTLVPSVPTTAREALDLAWELAHEVREGQTIPKGTKYLERHNGALREYTAFHDMNPKAGGEEWLRTQDPLPDPELDWFDAPAVLATQKHSNGHLNPTVWTRDPFDSDRWVTGLISTHWRDLRDVTPLYPKEDEEPGKSDTPNDAPRTYSACLNYDGPWGTRLGGDPA